MDQKLNSTGCYHHCPISLSVFPENKQDIPGAICNWSKCSFWGRVLTSTGRGRMPPNLLQHQNKTHQSYWLLVFSCGAKRLWSPENSLARSPAFLWQLQSYVNYTGASHFRNFPPSSPTLVLTKHRAGGAGRSPGILTHEWQKGASPSWNDFYCANNRCTAWKGVIWSPQHITECFWWGQHFKASMVCLAVFTCSSTNAQRVSCLRFVPGVGSSPFVQLIQHFTFLFWWFRRIKSPISPSEMMEYSFILEKF